MAAQVLNKTYRAFMILTLFTMICSIQVSDSIPRDVCIKDCVINQCMKASKKQLQQFVTTRARSFVIQ
ncbi:unnamed protein product [Brassica oleracea]